MSGRRLAAAVGAAGIVSLLSVAIAFAGAASIKVSVGSAKLTVSGNAGGKIGSYAQVYFDSQECASSFYTESGRRSASGDVLTPSNGGAFHETWPIAGLTSGTPPIQRYVCAYVVGMNTKGEMVALAADTGSLPVHKKK